MFIVVKFHALVFLIMTPCGDVGGYQCIEGPCCLHLQASPWKWKQHSSPKCWYPTTLLQCHNPEDQNMNKDIRCTQGLNHHSKSRPGAYVCMRASAHTHTHTHTQSFNSYFIPSMWYFPNVFKCCFTAVNTDLSKMESYRGERHNSRWCWYFNETWMGYSDTYIYIHKTTKCLSTHCRLCQVDISIS
jgi:hypothetical protein